MHTLKPNTDYQIVTVRLAIQGNAHDAATDGLNEVFRRTMDDAPDFIGDYMFEPEVYDAHTSSDPEGGELFPFDHPMFGVSGAPLYKSDAPEPEPEFEIEALLPVSISIHPNDPDDEEILEEYEVNHDREYTFTRYREAPSVFEYYPHDEYGNMLGAMAYRLDMAADIYSAVVAAFRLQQAKRIPEKEGA